MISKFLLSAAVVAGILGSSVGHAEMPRCEALLSALPSAQVVKTFPTVTSQPTPVPKAIATETKPIDPNPVNINDLLQVQVPDGRMGNFKVTLAALFNTIQTQYGPLRLKSSTVGIDFHKMMTDALSQANNITDTNTQNYTIANFMAQFNDAHVQTQLPSTLVWTLPLQVRQAESRLIVNFVDATYPAGLRSPQLGDELVGINGMSPDAFQKQFPTMNSVANSLTSKTIFGLQLAGWKEASGMPLSALNWDGLQLSFKDSNTGEVFQVGVPFTKSGLGLIGAGVHPSDAVPNVISAGNLSRAKTMNLKLTAPHSEKIFQRFRDLFDARILTNQVAGHDPIGRRPLLPQGQGPRGKGAKLQIGNSNVSFQLPPDFKPITLPSEILSSPVLAMTMNADFFRAGTFQYNGKTVGFLRIPSYDPANLDTMLPTVRFFVSQLQEQSDYLVIDQTANPGGEVVFSDMIAKSLVGTFDPSKHLRFAVRPSQGFLRQFLEMRNEVAANADGLFTAQEAQAFAAQLDTEYQKIHDAFVKHQDLSQPVSLMLISEYVSKSMERALAKGIQVGDQVVTLATLNQVLGIDIQKPQVYTKPVYMMINELDFSAGDATPATLQDYGRVKLVGTRTAGAGGTVEEFSFRGAVEVVVRMTTSLMVRANGGLVENYGVHPNPGLDVPVLVTDIKDGGAAYFGRILAAVDKDLHASPATALRH